MDSVNSSFCEICPQCRKSFSQPTTFTHHQRNCSKTKKRLSDALAKAKEKWIVKKRRRIFTLEDDNVLPLTVDAQHRAAEDILVIEDAPTIAVRMISCFIYHLTR